ncbi:MAG: hypothetical protein CME65_03305 [Halobacteriovoraceae bacterium]|nr:hypothetical protein [Halobacteriovoraceae bacterium]|tara:strand:- start:11782 stop:12330 length:549 start_codon:yes stop_codon:yes gene_type:complete
MKLYGSLASPYVRRIRIQLEDRKYDFEPINVFSDEGQKELLKYAPTMRVPLLVDRDNVIWDSLLIAQYIAGNPFSLDLQKELVLINEMSDSGIQLYQLRKFNLDSNDKGEFSQNNLRRISSILEYFEQRNLEKWDILSQWLYCTLDWFSFREVYSWKEHSPKLVKFMQDHKDRPYISQTSPG